MAPIKRIVNQIIRIIKRDTKLALITLVLLTALVVGSFLVGFVNTLIVLIIVGLIVFSYFKRRRSNNSDPLHRKRKKKIKTIVLIICLILAIILTIGIGGFCYYIVDKAPSFDEDKLYKQETSVLYDSAGDIIAKLGSEKRQKITFDQLPQVLVDAVVATEDSRFFQHNGFDLPRFSKAAFGQVTGNDSAGGGSTITMQVVKNTLTSTNQNIVRKFTDIYLAVFVLEKKYTKEEIFELYVNIPYLGSNSYGVEEASRTYFKKSVSQLSLSEAALLAGLFQSPGAYDPYNYPDKAEARRTTVLHLMKLHGYITADEEKMANSIPVENLLASTNRADATTNKYQAFIDLVVKEIQEKTKTTPYETAMEVYTTMHRGKQDALTNAIDALTFKDDFAQTGIAMTNTKTGAVVAIYGGRNKTGERTYNYAFDIKKHIGSSAKPIFDYGPGVEYLNWNELTMFKDEPWAYSDGTKIKNFDGSYMGNITMKVALAKSRNIPALKAFQTVGNKKSLEFVLGLGMSPEIVDGVIYETHAVGAYNGESPLTMAGAYAAFGNGGYYIKPYSVAKIVYKNSGKEKVYKAKKTQAMSDSTAFIITDCLMSVVTNGTGGRARVSGIQMAAKTGTSNYDTATKQKYHLPSNAVNDLWLMAYSSSYTLGIWYGYDKIASDHYSVSGDNGKVVSAAVKAVFTEKGDKFTIPDSVIKVTVEKGTNPISLPSPFTPDSQLVSAWFKVGAEPTEISGKYSALNNVTDPTWGDDDGKIYLQWNHTPTPNLAAYLTKYGDSVGEVGYNIYKKSATGALTLLSYTEDKIYSVGAITKETSFVIKSTFSLSQTTESSGTTITVSPKTFNIVLNGDEIGCTVDEKCEDADPPLYVTDINGTAITDYILNVTLGGKKIEFPQYFEKADVYTVKYIVTYNGVNQTVNRKFTVTE